MTKSTTPSRRAVVAGLTAGGALITARPSLSQATPLPPLTLWLSREPSGIQTREAMVAFLLKHNPPG